MKMASQCLPKGTTGPAPLLGECSTKHSKVQAELGTLPFVIVIIQSFSQVQFYAQNGIKQSQVKKP